MTMEPDADVVQDAAEIVDQMWDDPGGDVDDEMGAYTIDSVALPSDDQAEQASFLAGAPEWAIVHPSTEQFDNATRMPADEVRPIVDRMLQWDELKSLRDFGYEVRWFRHRKPVRRTRMDEEIILAGVSITAQGVLWEALQQGCETYPHLTIELYWGHFEDRRKAGDDGLRYVHHDEVARAIHRALMGLNVQGAEIVKIGADVSEFAATVERFGQHGPGMRALRRQLKLLPDDSGE